MPVARPTGRCPHCHAAFDVVLPRPSYAPFCSARCKMADLSKWLGGEYAIAGAPVDDGETAPDDKNDE